MGFSESKEYGLVVVIFKVSVEDFGVIRVWVKVKSVGEIV